ncbi:MAG: class I SAM-dependent methyltransferase [Candidatus Pacebacteria bacterium]|nr:class I SAM-dependent methyltransferase [Candidatus Paceibacterota bacterium]MCF7857570.1 class I SAM-dependent methyltransferase [Candidatus Paceibacterota bacterium]
MSQKFVQSDWEEYARCYDSLLNLTPYQHMLERVARNVRTTQHYTILDASCGTGNFEKVFCESSDQNFQITGIDRAGAMLERARKKCASWPHCFFAETDLNQNLDFEDESFGQVVSINTLYAVKNPETTLREFFRVLVPGGVLFLVTPKYGYENGLILKEHCRSSKPDSYWVDVHQSPEREEKLIREALDDEVAITDMLTIARFNRSIASEDTFHFYYQEELKTVLEKVGLAVKEVSYVYAHQDIFAIAQKET